jgi:hypothetical protein
VATLVSEYTPAAPDEGPEGAEYVFTLTTPEIGVWNYVLSETAVLTSNRAVIFSFQTASPLSSSMVLIDHDVTVGDYVDLAIATADDVAVLTGITIDASCTRTDDSSSVPFSVIFRDDGVDPDDTANDGAYAAAILTTEPGEFFVAATITGTNRQGHAFARSAGARFAVHPVRAKFTGTFTDRGIDLDGNGLYEQIGITPQITVTVPGRYALGITLQATNGRTVSLSTIVALAAGTQSPEVAFAADRLEAALGVGGPYVLSACMLELIEDPPTPKLPSTRTGHSQLSGKARDVDPDLEGVRLAADTYFLAASTAAYQLNQFDRRAVDLLAEGHVVEPVDIDGNGKFDRLDAACQMNVLHDGDYTWSADLATISGTLITSASGQGHLVVGQAILLFQFSGSDIGQLGLDGPFAVRNVRVAGTGGSARFAEVMVTGSHAATSFEGGSCGFAGPAPIVVQAAAGQCFASVSFSRPTAPPTCPHSIVLCSHPSVAAYPLGTTTVSCVARDRDGGAETCSFAVTVVPALSCPVDITATAQPGSSTRVVTYTAPAIAGGCNSPFAVTCTPGSGSEFPIGSTTVNCVASDGIGHSVPCSFTVTVYRVNVTVRQQFTDSFRGRASP